MERKKSISRKTRWEATAVTQAKYDGGLDQGGKCRDGEKLLDSRYFEDRAGRT